MPPNPYQRIIVSGIPVWKGAEGRLYYYETATPPTEATRIQIGTEAGGFNPDWKNILESRVKSYQDNSQSRLRAEKK